MCPVSDPSSAYSAPRIRLTNSRVDSTGTTRSRPGVAGDDQRRRRARARNRPRARCRGISRIAPAIYAGTIGAAAIRATGARRTNAKPRRPAVDGRGDLRPHPARRASRETAGVDQPRARRCTRLLRRSASTPGAWRRDDDQRGRRAPGCSRRIRGRDRARRTTRRTIAAARCPLRRARLDLRDVGHRTPLAVRYDAAIGAEAPASV